MCWVLHTLCNYAEYGGEERNQYDVYMVASLDKGLEAANAKIAEQSICIDELEFKVNTILIN